MDGSSIYIIALVILVCLSALFSCMETAFLSVNKFRMRTLEEEGNNSAKQVLKLLDNSDRLFSTILVVNNVVNLGASSLTTSAIISIMGNDAKTLAYATGIITLLILIFGEITPKNFATRKADSIALALAGFINMICIITTPIVFCLNCLSKFIMKLFGGEEDSGPSVTEEDLKTIVTVSHEEGVIEEEEKEMIHNVVEFGDTTIEEIMTPRIHVSAIDKDCSYDELIEVFNEHQYSRYPVYNESFDDVVGVLHIKDLLFQDVDTNDFHVDQYMREAFIAYEFNKVSDIFERMREERATIAVVVDEYGVMTGIVTFEDIVEEIVGDIDDEYDETDNDIIKISQGVYLVDGTMNIDEVNDELGTELDSEDFESIGGLVLGELNDRPEIDDEVQIDNVLLRVVKVHKNHIEQLKITILEKEKQ